MPTWGNDPIWRAYFSTGLVQPPTRDCLSGWIYPGHPSYHTSWGSILGHPKHSWNINLRRYDWASVVEPPAIFMSTSVLSLDLLVGSWTWWEKFAKSQVSFPVGSFPYFQVNIFYVQMLMSQNTVKKRSLQFLVLFFWAVTKTLVMDTNPCSALDQNPAYLSLFAVYRGWTPTQFDKVYHKPWTKDPGTWTNRDFMGTMSSQGCKLLLLIDLRFLI